MARSQTAAFRFPGILKQFHMLRCNRIQCSNGCHLQWVPTICVFTKKLHECKQSSNDIYNISDSISTLHLSANP